MPRGTPSGNGAVMPRHGVVVNLVGHVQLVAFYFMLASRLRRRQYVAFIDVFIIEIRRSISTTSDVAANDDNSGSKPEREAADFEII